jgi:hypothetical protein
MNAATSIPTTRTVRGTKTKACLAVSKLFLKNGPLKRFGFRKDEITRFDSMDNYVSERVEQINDYIELFNPYVSFAGKTVLELGCNKGYLLNSFLQYAEFEAIGAENRS